MIQSSPQRKPAPLTFNSQRTSPFKRPESPLGRSPSAARPEGPRSSPLKQSPSFTFSSSPSGPAQIPISSTQNISIPVLPEPLEPILAQLPPIKSPQEATSVYNSQVNESLSRLHPSQVRDLRESFQVLDRDNDGQVTRDDVAEVLTQLGLDTSPNALHPYFPSNSPSTLTLPSYLSSISTRLASLSPQPELAAAFAAFDPDDSGQIDIDDLRDSLVRTPCEGGMRMTAQDIDTVVEGFRGRRALAKGMFGKEATKRGDVFRYKEFLGSLAGVEKEGGGPKGSEGVKGFGFELSDSSAAS